MNIVDINMLSWIFYLHFIAMAYICSILAIYKIDNNYIIATVDHSKEHVYYYVWMSVMYTMILFPLSVLLVKQFMKKRISKRILLELSDRFKNRNKNKELYGLYLMSIVCLISCVYTFYSFGYIGIFSIFKSEVLADMRAYWYNTRNVNPYIKNILGLSLAKFLSFIFYVYWKVFNKQKFFILFILFFCVAIAMQSMDMTKSSIVLYLIGLYSLDVALRKEKKYLYFVVLVVVTFLILIITYSNIQKYSLDMIWKALYHRIFTVQLEAAYKTFEFFPDNFDFIGFNSLSPHISDLFGFKYIERHAAILKRMIYSIPEGIPLPGGMVSLFFAEAWANFGLIGILISPVVCGIYTGMLYYTTRFSKKIESFALYGLFAVSVPISEGFNQFIYPVWIIVPLLLYFMIKILNIFFGSIKVRQNRKTENKNMHKAIIEDDVL